MSSVNNTNGPVDFWANLKKQKEEEARQKEQEARELAMPFDVQQDEIDNLPEPEPDDDTFYSDVSHHLHGAARNLHCRDGLRHQLCSELCTADDGRYDRRLLFLSVHCGSALHHVGCA